MMRREALYPEIKRLREDEGLMWKEIGRIMGLALQTVHDYYVDPDGSDHRARHKRWEATDYSICACGARMMPERKGTKACRECYDKAEAAAHEARIADVAEMYREGMPVREIARELGYGPNSKAPEIIEARRLGLIGYRNRGYGEAA